MALWYDCGNGMVKTSFARKSVSSHAYIVCPGPSLKNVNPHILNRRLGVTVFGLTTSYPTIKPDVWIGMDRVECYDRQLWWESFVKICRGNYSDMTVEGEHPIKSFPNTFFADCSEPKDREEIFTARAHDVRFVWHKNSFAIALHVAIWMGYKKFHFVGCDLTKGYFDGRMVGVEREASNQRLYDQIYEYMAWFVPRGKSHGISCVSCGESSRLNTLMDFVPLDTALTNSEREAKRYAGLPVYHAKDAEKMYSPRVSDVIYFDPTEVKDAELFLEGK